jgi:hypothetical protein
MFKLDKISVYLRVFEIVMPEVHVAAFQDFKKLPKQRGLYSIWQGDQCVYVGQGGGMGGIRDRFNHHYNKAHAIFETSKGTRNGTQDGAGWRYHRENSLWTPDQWRVEYILMPKAVDRTLVEGIMMKILDPWCNDENYEDRLL